MTSKSIIECIRLSHSRHRLCTELFGLQQHCQHGKCVKDFPWPKSVLYTSVLRGVCLLDLELLIILFDAGVCKIVRRSCVTDIAHSSVY
jgi:hypothetical protein